jgi:hypothetical protein
MSDLLTPELLERFLQFCEDEARMHGAGAPLHGYWARRAATLRAYVAIVEAIAAESDPRDSDGVSCRFCHVKQGDPSPDDASTDTLGHERDCLWIRARKLRGETPEGGRYLRLE